MVVKKLWMSDTLWLQAIRRFDVSRLFTLFLVVLCFLLFACACNRSSSQSGPRGPYRVETVKSINTPVSLVREYVIQTSSYRAIALDGSVSAAPILISPDSVVNGKRANAEVSLTATLVGREEDAQVKVEMVVRTGGGVAITFTRTLRAPSVSDIMSVVADSVPEGDIKTKTCLLTIGTDDEAVEVIIM